MRTKVIPMPPIQKMNKTYLLLGGAALVGVFFYVKHNNSIAAQAAQASADSSYSSGGYMQPQIISGAGGGGISGADASTANTGGSGSSDLSLLAALGFMNNTVKSSTAAADASTAYYNSSLDNITKQWQDQFSQFSSQNDTALGTVNAALDAALHPAIDPIAKAAADLAAAKEANDFLIAQKALDIQSASIASNTQVALANDTTNRLGVLVGAASLSLANDRPAANQDMVTGFNLNLTDSNGQAIAINATKTSIDPGADASYTVKNLPTILKTINEPQPATITPVQSTNNANNTVVDLSNVQVPVI